MLPCFCLSAAFRYEFGQVLGLNQGLRQASEHAKLSVKSYQRHLLNYRLLYRAQIPDHSVSDTTRLRPVGSFAVVCTDREFVNPAVKKVLDSDPAHSSPSSFPCHHVIR
jgi:hypothetical protein